MPRCPQCHRRIGVESPCPLHADISLAAEVQSGDVPRVPGYKLNGALGAGGFATVWSTHPAHGGEQVAIKVARAAGSHAETRLRAEREAMERVGPPWAPRVFGDGLTEDGRPFLAMERIRRRSLADELLGRAQPLPAHRQHAIADAVLTALEAAHARGVAHRDLKPENVFPGERGPAVLVDFGAARVRDRDARLTRTGWAIGTALYMAPEQLAGERAGPPADIYALGVVLFECMTLRPPFTGDAGEIEHGHRLLRPPRPSELMPVPAALEELCLACLAKAPQERPSARALRAALRSGSWRLTASLPPPETTRLSAAQQPVVLLYVDRAPFSPEADADVRSRGGVIARHRGRSFVCAFSALGERDPAESALDAASALLARDGGRAALHLAELRVRDSHGAGAFRVYGADVESPERWLPSAPWSGVALTAAFAEALAPDAVRPLAEAPGWFASATPAAAAIADTTPLYGRHLQLAAAEASLERCSADGVPTLWTAIADRGAGKSRFARELTARAAQLWPDARVARVTLRRGDSVGELAHALGAELDLTVPVDPTALGDALRTEAAHRPIAIILDDAQGATDAALDAIEYATLDAHGIPLWVATVGSHRLERRRPLWGTQAGRHERVSLPPLSDDAAAALAGAFLSPAEYPPRAALARLAEWSGGMPGVLEAMCRRLKRDGLVRKRAHSDSWYLATDELDRLPALPASQWLGSRELDTMDPDLASCARVCAVLGAHIRRDELAFVQDAAARSGQASTPVDADVGLRELTRAGLLAPRGGDWTFARPLLAEAIYQLLDRRDREALHRHALAFWAGRGDGDAAIAAIARHAAACGEAATAATANLELGDRARAVHRHVEAEQRYSAALELTADDDLAAHALLGRGRVRYRMQRTREAIDDLRAARDRAYPDDLMLRADSLLEEATALDWADEFRASAARAEQARPLVMALTTPTLIARLTLALGRSAWRAERIGEAVELLEAAREHGASLGDDETRIIALLLLGVALVYHGRPDDARERLGEAIELCERADDRLHLCAAYVNRMFTWRDMPEHAVADLRTAIRLAREIGQPTLERMASHNLAELLYWRGDDDEALQLARRSRVLQERLFSAPVADDALLLARIECARGAAAACRRWLDWIDAHVDPDDLAPRHRILARAVELGLSTEPRGWSQVVQDATQQLVGEELLEVLFYALRAGEPGAAQQCRELLADHPIWAHRLEPLVASRATTSRSS